MGSRLWTTVTVALAVAGCSSGSRDGAGDSEPTMTLHTAQELVRDPKLFAEVNARCDQWKASQKSPLSFPAVVITSCNNLDEAKRQKASARDIRELREGFGLDEPSDASGNKVARP